MRLRGSKAISLVVQLQRLLAQYPESSGEIVRSKLSWRCRLRPQSITATYLFEIEYRLGEKPIVYISEFRLASEQNLHSVPHHYDAVDDDRMHACLDRYDWNKTMFLADSVVPWAMEWALYYEIWLETGTWQADEAPNRTGAFKNPGRCNYVLNLASG